MTSTITITDEQVEQFVDGFATAHLWANVESVEYGDDGEPRTDEHGETIRNEDASVIAEHGGGLHSFDDVSQREIRQVCEDFLTSNAADLLAASEQREWSYLGHDFALNAAGHGTGFWDRGLGEVGDRLSEASKVYGDMGGWLDADDTAHFGY